MKKYSLSIIIVNYNTKELLQRCLDSLSRASTSADEWEIIVIDNASTDGSKQIIEGYKKNGNTFFKNIVGVCNRTNVGFSSANNQGIKKAHGRYILLLNSDTEVYQGTIQAMLQFMEKHSKVGVGTCKIELSDGTIDPACHRGFPTPWAALTYFMGLEKLFPKSPIFSRYHLGSANMAVAHQIDSPSGAFFLTRSDVVSQVGLLDEDYFMYGEDLDWAYRIKHAGWEIWFYPDAAILHRKKQSGRAHPDKKLRKKTQRYFYQTMQTFYQKHYVGQYPKIITWIIIFFLHLRLFAVDAFGV